MITPHRGLGFSLALFAVLSSADATARRAKSPPLVVPLRVRVARCADKPVRSNKWVQRHIKAANAVLRPHAITLRARIEAFAPARCVLTTRAHRHALAVHVDSAEPTVLIVKRAQDVDVRGYNLMGVHWRYRGANARLTGRRWVILTARARPPVLAHELGHFFGLPHDPAGGNLMTPGPSAPIWKRKDRRPKPFQPRLTRAQARRVRAAARAFVNVASARP